MITSEELCGFDFFSLFSYLYAKIWLHSPTMKVTISSYSLLAEHFIVLKKVSRGKTQNGCRFSFPWLSQKLCWESEELIINRLCSFVRNPSNQKCLKDHCQHKCTVLTKILLNHPSIHLTQVKSTQSLPQFSIRKWKRKSFPQIIFLVFFLNFFEAHKHACIWGMTDRMNFFFCPVKR